MTQIMKVLSNMDIRTTAQLFYSWEIVASFALILLQIQITSRRTKIKAFVLFFLHGTAQLLYRTAAQTVKCYRTTKQPVNLCVHRHYMNMLPFPKLKERNADLHKPRTSSRKLIQRFFVPLLQTEKYQMELIDTQRLKIKRERKQESTLTFMGTSDPNISIVTTRKAVAYYFLIQLKLKYKYFPYNYIFLLSVEMRLFSSF